MAYESRFFSSLSNNKESSEIFSQGILWHQGVDLQTSESYLHWPLRMSLGFFYLGMALLLMKGRPEWLPTEIMSLFQASPTQYIFMQVVGWMSFITSMGYLFYPRPAVVFLGILLNIPCLLTFLQEDMGSMFILDLFPLFFFPVLFMVIHRYPLSSWVRFFRPGKNYPLFKELSWVEILSEKDAQLFATMGLGLLGLMLFGHGFEQVFFPNDLLTGLYSRLGFQRFFGEVNFILFLFGSLEMLAAILLVVLKQKQLLPLLKMLVVWKLMTELLFLLSGWEGSILYVLTRIPVMIMPLVVYYLMKIKYRQAGLVPMTNFSLEKTRTWSFEKHEIN
jgi:hypothetical protein